MKVFVRISVFLVLISATNVIAAPIKYKYLERKKWTLTESPNFQIVSDVKPKKVREVAEQLERFRAFSGLFLNLGSARYFTAKKKG